MKAWMKSLICIALSLMCLFTCVGYAQLGDYLTVNGTASATPVLPDIYISKCEHYSYVGAVKVENLATSGTVLTADISGAGTHSFWITVKNISDIHYVYDCTVDGSQAGIEGVYSGTDITYQVYLIQQGDAVNSKGERLFYVDIIVPEGTVADNYLLKFKFVEKFATPGEEEFPEEMPDDEISIVQRLSDILNNKYKTAEITNSRAYLIEETIRRTWNDEGGDPYVGSRDEVFLPQIHALFDGVLFEDNVYFILKNQDLNGDGYNEIALYSTSDTLDSDAEYPTNAVCVYITVFTPVLDAWKNIIGYTMVCESLRGYAPEVRYGPKDSTYSFSTDHWRDDIGYFVWNELTQTSDTYRVPEDALANDGSGKPFREDFNSYNQYYQNKWQATTPYGRASWECLYDKIPWLG